MRFSQDSVPTPSTLFPSLDTGRATSTSSATDKNKILYKCIPRGLLPSGRGRNPRSNKVGGVSPAERLTEFVRGLLGTRGQRATDSAINSRIKKLVHLSNASVQAEVHSATARAARAAGKVQLGLSGKQFKKKVTAGLEIEAVSHDVYASSFNHEPSVTTGNKSITPHALVSWQIKCGICSPRAYLCPYKLLKEFLLNSSPDAMAPWLTLYADSPLFMTLVRARDCTRQKEGGVVRFPSVTC